jgi:hypothetical protein
MTRHTWTLAAAAPPSAWAALVADAKALIAVARARGITVAGPAGTGQPVLDGERIALAVRTAGGLPFSAPFVFSRTLPGGQLDTVDSGLYDSMVLTALQRAARYFGAVLSTTTEADPRTTAQAYRLTDLVFGADDRRIAGGDEPTPRVRIEQIVASHLDDLDNPDDPRDVTTLLGELVQELAAEHAGRVAAEQPVP